MHRLLVTGGAGFIGTNFVHYRLREHPDDRLVVLDALTYAGNFANLNLVKGLPQLRLVHGDICDRALVEEVMRAEQIDTIVHFAAESHVDRSIASPEVFIRTNVLGTHALLDVSRKLWLRERFAADHRFHHISTDEVYGSLGADDPAFSEDRPYSPNSPYAASKAASDHLVRAYHHTYGLRTTISNCSNNYGPFQFPEKLIPLLITNILSGRPLPIYGDGRNVRDWLHVNDHCRGIDLILSHGRVGEVYNVGGRSECENLQLARLLCETADEIFRRRPELQARFASAPAARGEPSAALIRFVADRPGHDRRYAIDCAKIERQLHFALSTDLRSGLRATLEWYIENETWVESATKGAYRDWIEERYGQGASTTSPAGT
ncbi:MAG: dTDP-glucose 4,6-dehydratase [Steroidobacteraceae bacterium]